MATAEEGCQRRSVRAVIVRLALGSNRAKGNQGANLCLCIVQSGNSFTWQVLGDLVVLLGIYK